MQRCWVVPSSLETADGAQDAGAWGQDYCRGRWADIQAKTWRWELLRSPDTVLGTRGPLKVLKAKERHAQSHSPIYPHGLPSGSHSLFRGHGRRPEGQGPSGQRSGRRAQTPRATGRLPALLWLSAPQTHSVGRTVGSMLVLRGLVPLVGGNPVVHEPGGKTQNPRKLGQGGRQQPQSQSPRGPRPCWWGGPASAPLPSPHSLSLLHLFFGLSSILSQIPKVEFAKYQVSGNSLAAQ